MSDGAQRSICCSSLKTNKKQILRSAQDDRLGGFFSSLLVSLASRQIILRLSSLISCHRHSDSLVGAKRQQGVRPDLSAYL